MGFNNLTYLPFMERDEWKGNPLGETGAWTAAGGRQWRTECDTAATGRNGCCSYTMTTVYSATLPRASHPCRLLTEGSGTDFGIKAFS